MKLQWSIFLSLKWTIDFKLFQSHSKSRFRDFEALDFPMIWFSGQKSSLCWKAFKHMLISLTRSRRVWACTSVLWLSEGSKKVCKRSCEESSTPEKSGMDLSQAAVGTHSAAAWGSCVHTGQGEDSSPVWKLWQNEINCAQEIPSCFQNFTHTKKSSREANLSSNT